MEVVICDGVRTPFGKLGGGLSQTAAPALGAVVLKALVERNRLEHAAIDHVIMGTVLAAGQGQVPSRQATLLAGFPPSIPSFTVNKVCASSLKAINLAASMIRAGDARLVLAGGMESMSNAPYLLRDYRFGSKLGDRTAVDSLVYDGLCCPVDGVHMGVHGGEVAAELSVTRQAQDEWAYRSQQRYAAALANGIPAAEIVPVETPSGVVDRDEQPRPDTTLEKLASLKPAFSPGATVTAGNSPGINDGAAAVIVASRERAEELGLTVLATWVSFGQSAEEHPYLATVPALALQDAVTRAGGKPSVPELSLLEINEAFAAVAITSTSMLSVSPDIVNVNGGAIALGHPIGASGARLLLTLIGELRRRGGGYGGATLCSGLAQGEATIVRVDA